MSPTSYQAALPRVIPSLLSATLIIIPYSNGFVKRVRKVFLQQKQRTKTRLLTFFPESQQARQFTPLREGRRDAQAVRRLRTQFQFTPLREGRLDARPPDYVPELISIHAPPRGATNEVIRQRKKRNISIHAPPRGATAGSRPQPARRGYFNSRPSARGDTISTFLPSCTALFQFTPLREGRPHIFSRWRVNAHFNSRPSARGDPCSKWFERSADDFNSRPSARGDSTYAALCALGYISIHAPPRGATKADMRQVLTPIIFQFTPLREGRLGRIHRNPNYCCISIHAPPRGATPLFTRISTRSHFNSRPSARGDLIFSSRSASCSSFQFTPLREGRRAIVRRIFQIVVFQFTPLREGRLQTASCLCRMSHFNSRPSARGDDDKKRRDAVVLIFQFTPLREGRRYFDTVPHKATKFQFTPLREGRLPTMRVLIAFFDFNSRPSARGDVTMTTKQRNRVLFQFTPLREGRPLAPLHFLLKVAISIHAPPRGATLVDASVFALCKISIHAPPRGATRKNALVLSSTTFQFTPLREGRRSDGGHFRNRQDFNSRPSARGDQE